MRYVKYTAIRTLIDFTFSLNKFATIAGNNKISGKLIAINNFGDNDDIAALAIPAQTTRLTL